MLCVHQIYRIVDALITSKDCDKRVCAKLTNFSFLQKTADSKAFSSSAPLSSSALSSSTVTKQPPPRLTRRVNKPQVIIFADYSSIT